MYLRNHSWKERKNRKLPDTSFPDTLLSMVWIVLNFVHFLYHEGKRTFSLWNELKCKVLHSGDSVVDFLLVLWTSGSKNPACAHYVNLNTLSDQRSLQSPQRPHRWDMFNVLQFEILNSWWTRGVQVFILLWYLQMMWLCADRTACLTL